MRNFDLVQRLEQQPPTREAATASPTEVALARMGASGMGSVSLMDSDLDPVYRAGLGFGYMGSAEFEWGAVPQSAQRIIANTDRLEVVSTTLIRPTYEEPVHFVCTEEQADTILPAWHRWTHNPITRENPLYIKDFDEDPIFEWERDRTVAWWALNEDLLWTRDVDLAAKLQEGFTQRKYELFAQQSLPKRLLAKLMGAAPK